MKRNVYNLFRIVLVLLVLATLAHAFYQSSLPVNESVEQSNKVGEIIEEIIPPETKPGEFIQKNLRKFKKDESRTLRQSTQGFADKVNPDYVKAPAVAKQEETVLGLLFLYPDHRNTVFSGELLSEADFFTELNRRFFTYLKEAHDAHVDPSASLDESFTPAEIGRVTKMKLARMQLTDNGDEVLSDAILRLKEAVRRTQAKETTTLSDLSSLISSLREKNTPDQ